MKTKISYIAPVAMICVLALGIVAGRADERENQRNAYAVTSLVSDLKGVGAIQDPVLQNAWVWRSHRPAVPSGSLITQPAARRFTTATAPRLRCKYRSRYRGTSFPLPIAKPS